MCLTSQGWDRIGVGHSHDRMIVIREGITQEIVTTTKMGVMMGV